MRIQSVVTKVTITGQTRTTGNPRKHVTPEIRKAADDAFDVHTVLDTVGFVPVVGEPADLVNGLIYAAEKDYINAGISIAAVIPVVGDLGKAGKYGVKALKAIDKGGDLAKTFNVASKPLSKKESKTFRIVANGIEKVAKENADEAVEAVGKGSKAVGKGALKTVDTGDLKVMEMKTPEVANSEWLAKGYDKPPYNQNFEVKVVQAGNEKYVRVFSYNSDGTSNKLGGWLMKKSDIEGLTPAQIADKYALPKEPTHICDVNLDPDFRLQTGISNPVEGWGKGGGQQFDTMGKIVDEDAFVYERLIGE